MSPAPPKPLPAIQLFRARDASDFVHSGMMTADAPLAEEVGVLSQALIDEGMLDGSKLSVLFRRPGGFSLTHVWFKSGFPLPSHSHSTPCLYYVLAGSLKVGTQELSAGDGFYISAETPYIYVPGPHGVEVLEFRDADSFDIKVRDHNPKWWVKALERLRVSRKSWSDEGPPSGREIA
ncbi:MAG: cupin domain-containing protein [Novosphingobium sp.]